MIKPNRSARHAQIVYLSHGAPISPSAKRYGNSVRR